MRLPRTHHVFRRASLACALCVVLAAPSFPATRVVVEAAHGGSDHGSKASGQSEKDWNLRFAQAFAKAVEAAGYDAVETRSKDQEVPSEKRFEVLNTSGASLGVVFHMDRESTGQVSGPLFVVQPPQTTALANEEGLPEAGTIPLSRFHRSLRLARSMAEAVGASSKFSPLSEDRAIGSDKEDPKGSILAVPHQSLRYAAVPAVVVTPLFLSHPEDLKRYSDDAAIQAFCASLVKGLQTYLEGDTK